MTDLQTYERQFQKTTEFLQHEFSSIRAGRANPALIEHCKAEYYGTPTPLNQLGTILASDPMTLQMQVWDASAVPAVEKAIRQSDLGLNPAVEGQLLRIPIPLPSEERRQELVKLAKQKAESARVSIRTTREEAMKHLRQQEEAKTLSEDQAALLKKELQKLVDAANQQVQRMLTAKEEDILRV